MQAPQYSDPRQQEIAGYYQNILGRAPEAEGLQFWTNNYDKFKADGDFLNDFIPAASPELNYKATGGASNPIYSGGGNNNAQMMDMFKGMMGGFQDALSGLGNMFQNQNSQSSVKKPENHWQTDYNQSSVLPPQYQTDMGGAKNGSGGGWGANNPWNIKTF